MGNRNVSACHLGDVAISSFHSQSIGREPQSGELQMQMVRNLFCSVDLTDFKFWFHLHVSVELCCHTGSFPALLFQVFSSTFLRLLFQTFCFIQLAGHWGLATTAGLQHDYQGSFSHRSFSELSYKCPVSFPNNDPEVECTKFCQA